MQNQVSKRFIGRRATAVAAAGLVGVGALAPVAEAQPYELSACSEDGVLKRPGIAFENVLKERGIQGPLRILDSYASQFPDDVEFINGVRSYVTQENIVRRDGFHPDFIMFRAGTVGIPEGETCDSFVASDEFYTRALEAHQLDSLARRMIRNSYSREGVAPPLHATSLARDADGNLIGITTNEDGTLSGNLSFVTNGKRYPTWNPNPPIDFIAFAAQYEREKRIYEMILSARERYESETGSTLVIEGGNPAWEFRGGKSRSGAGMMTASSAYLEDAWMIQDEVFHMVKAAEEKANAGTLTQEELDEAEYFLNRLATTNPEEHEPHPRIGPPPTPEDLKDDVFNPFGNYQEVLDNYEENVGTKFVERFADRMKGDAFSPIDIVRGAKTSTTFLDWAWQLSPYFAPTPELEPTPTPLVTTTLPGTKVTTTIEQPPVTVTETPQPSTQTTTATATESVTTTVTEKADCPTVTVTPEKETVTLPAEPTTRTVVEKTTVAGAPSTVTVTPKVVTETVTKPAETVTKPVATTVIRDHTKVVKEPPVTVTTTAPKETETVRVTEPAPDTPLGAFSGTVVWDNDRSKTVGEGDERIVGLTVVALKDGKEIARTITDGNGFYKFDNLAPGEYGIAVYGPDGGHLFFEDKAATVVAGQEDTGNDWGFVREDAPAPAPEKPAPAPQEPATPVETVRRTLATTGAFSYALAGLGAVLAALVALAVVGRRKSASQ